jgi:hypothetical protein
MNEITDRFEVNYRLDSLIDLNEIAGYQKETDLLSLYEESDIWARRALAANGFGDY